MCGSMVDIQSPAAEIRRGKKKTEGKIVTTGQKYNGPPFHRAAIMMSDIVFKPQKCWFPGADLSVQITTKSSKINIALLTNKYQTNIEKSCFI